MSYLTYSFPNGAYSPTPADSFFSKKEPTSCSGCEDPIDEGKIKLDDKEWSYFISLKKNSEIETKNGRYRNWEVTKHFYDVCLVVKKRCYHTPGSINVFNDPLINYFGDIWYPSFDNKFKREGKEKTLDDISFGAFFQLYFAQTNNKLPDKSSLPPLPPQFVLIENNDDVFGKVYLLFLFIPSIKKSDLTNNPSDQGLLVDLDDLKGRDSNKVLLLNNSDHAFDNFFPNDSGAVGANLDATSQFDLNSAYSIASNQYRNSGSGRNVADLSSLKTQNNFLGEYLKEIKRKVGSTNNYQFVSLDNAFNNPIDGQRYLSFQIRPLSSFEIPGDQEASDNLKQHLILITKWYLNAGIKLKAKCSTNDKNALEVDYGFGNHSNIVFEIDESLNRVNFEYSKE